MAHTIKLIAARHIRRLLCDRAFSAQGINGKRQINLKRQQQVLRHGSAGFRPLIIDVQLCHVQRVQLQPAVQQCLRLPSQIDLPGVDDQPVFFPAQPANVATAAQAAAHILRNEHLPGGQIA